MGCCTSTPAEHTKSNTEAVPSHKNQLIDNNKKTDVGLEQQAHHTKVAVIPVADDTCTDTEPTDIQTEHITNQSTKSGSPKQSQNVAKDTDSSANELSSTTVNVSLTESIAKAESHSSDNGRFQTTEINTSDQTKEGIISDNIPSNNESNTRDSNECISDKINATEHVKQEIMSDNIQSNNTVSSVNESNELNVSNSSEPFDDIMGATVQNVEIEAERQQNIMTELQKLSFFLDKMEDRISDLMDAELIDESYDSDGSIHPFIDAHRPYDDSENESTNFNQVASLHQTVTGGAILVTDDDDSD